MAINYSAAFWYEVGNKQSPKERGCHFKLLFFLILNYNVNVMDLVLLCSHLLPTLPFKAEGEKENNVS